MAALLHDAIEDCGVTKPELIERFGAPVAELVDGLTKLDKLQFNDARGSAGRVLPQDAAGDGARRARDPDQAGRPHCTTCARWTTCRATSGARIARETLDIYAPIAHRLGLNQTYRELQELAFRTCSPWRHAVLGKAVQQGARPPARPDPEGAARRREARSTTAGMKVRIAGREKTLYSIYRKMRREAPVASRR